MSGSCSNCGAAVDTIDGVGYEFHNGEDGPNGQEGRQLCFDCEWDEYGGGIVAEGGEAWDQYKKRFG